MASLHQEYQRLCARFPHKVFVLLDRAEPGGKDLPLIDKRKYIVPKDITVGQFMFILRKRLNLPPEKAVFLFVRNALPTTAQTMSQLNTDYADSDGFLRMVYTGEAVFG
jgi:GABA(A) receptor-associated protein